MSKCYVCGKGNHRAKKYRYRGTYVTKRSTIIQHPNIKTVKIIEKGVVKKVPVCTRCLRSGKVKRVSVMPNDRSIQ